jgi:TonB family protein
MFNLPNQSAEFPAGARGPGNGARPLELAASGAGDQFEFELLSSWLARRFTLLQQVDASAGQGAWLAEELGQGRLVRLEVLTPPAAARMDLVELFYAEAEAAARLHHPYILRAEPAEPLGTTHFRLTEHLRDGHTLRSLLAQQGWLEVRRAGQLALQILNALTYAHQLGVWHLALHPEHIRLDANGEAVVGGFGLAAEPGLASLGLARVGLAQAQSGCPAYLSPEQIAGLPGDGRSDLYALGVLLYEMLTDRVPFDSDDLAYLKQRQRVQAPQPPHNFRPELPPELSQLVMRLLARQPEQRARLFSHAESFGARLRQATESNAAPVALSARSTNPMALAELSSAVLAETAVAPAVEPLSAQAVWQPETRTRPWLPSATQGMSAAARWTCAALLLLTPLSWWFWRAAVTGNPSDTAAQLPGQLGTAAPALTAAAESQDAPSAEPPPLNEIIMDRAARASGKQQPTSPAASAPPASGQAASGQTAPGRAPTAVNTVPPPSAADFSTAGAAPARPLPPLSRPRTVAEINAALAAGQTPPRLAKAVPGSARGGSPPAPPGREARRAAPIQFGAPLKRSATRLPGQPRSAGARGTVAVKVIVNERGQVISARAVTGPKALHARAEAAARQWLFQPSTRNGIPLQVVRQINFDFRPAPAPSRKR